MPMSDGQVGNLKAILREAFAVLAAILIAFALDAWWDDRVEQRDMREALAAVVDEIDRNVEMLDSAVAYNRRRAEDVARALDFTPAEVASMSDAEAGAFASLPNYQVVTLRLGAANAFSQGGYLPVVDDEEVRAAVAGLPRTQLEIDEELTVVNEFARTLNATLFEAYPMDRLRLPEDVFTPESARALLGAIATDEATRRALYSRTFALDAIYGGQLTALRDELLAVRARIVDELDL